MHKKVMFFSFVQVITRLIFGGVFFWAGTVKTPEIELFSYTMPAYNLPPESLILQVAIVGTVARMRHQPVPDPGILDVRECAHRFGSPHRNCRRIWH